MFLQRLSAWVVLASPVWATQVCANSSVPTAIDNWTQTATVARFDPALGVLNSISVVMLTNAVGSVQVESLDPIASTVVTTFHVQTQLKRPDSSTVLIVNAYAPGNITDNLTAYDGTLDFSGTSGATHNTVNAIPTTAVTTLNSPSDLMLFTGAPGNPGTIDLQLQSIEMTVVMGGSVVSHIGSSSSAGFTLCFDYTPGAVAFCFGDGSGSACPCGNSSAVGAGEGCANSFGQGAHLSAGGMSSVSNDTLVLACNGLPAATSVLFFQGTAQQSGGAGAAFGDGLRCVTGTIVRLHTAMTSAGLATWPQGGGPPISLTGSVSANSTRSYQVWYRNAVPFCTSATFNLSQGLTVTWSP